MTTAPSFVPDLSLYEGLSYRPPEPDKVTEEDGPVVGAFLDAAGARGLETWIQVQAAIPPCHRVQFGGPREKDHPLLPDGSRLSGRVDNNASLASPELRRYLTALIRDLCARYPQAHGLKFDWPEYAAYHFESLFFDFNPAAQPFAARLGLEFEALRRGASELLSDLGHPSVRLDRIAVDGFDSFRDSLISAYPVVAELLALRTEIVTDYARFLRAAVAEASDGRCKVFLQGFPPPLNVATGFDLGSMARHADLIGVKFYTMHWPMIEANYMRSLSSRSDFAPADIARALSAILGFSERTPRAASEIRYPEPDEAHPCASADLTSKMTMAMNSVPAGTRMCGITHGYGPTDDVIRRLNAVLAAQPQELHVNRFGYLSDEKLAAIGACISDTGTGQARGSAMG